MSKEPYNVTIEGVTIANSASHSIHLAIGYNPDHPDDLISWVKIFTWRANGDGLGSSGNQVMEDCFVRTQDDAAYVGGRGMRRVVFWLDSNGCVFVLNHIGTENINSHPLVIEDITVVYARTKFPHVGGNIFDLRGVGSGEGGYTITFRNFVVEDPRPTHQAFKLMMQGVQPWGKPDKRRGPGDLYGMTFQVGKFREFQKKHFSSEHQHCITGSRGGRAGAAMGDGGRSDLRPGLRQCHHRE